MQGCGRFFPQHIFVSDRRKGDTEGTVWGRARGQALHLCHACGSFDSLWTLHQANLRPKSHSQVTATEQVQWGQRGSLSHVHWTYPKETIHNGGVLLASPCSLHGRLSCKRLVA